MNRSIGLGPTAGGNSYFTRHNVSGSSVHRSGAHDEIKFSVLNLPFPSRELLESSVRRRRRLRHLHPRSHSFHQIRPCPSVSTSSSTASTRMCNFPALMKPTQSDRVALHGDLVGARRPGARPLADGRQPGAPAPRGRPARPPRRRAAWSAHGRAARPDRGRAARPPPMARGWAEILGASTSWKPTS